MNRTRAIHRHRGVAMALALIAVAITSVLGLSLLVAHGRAVPIASALQDHPGARLTAESGLEIAIGHIRGNPTWRTDRVNGVWFSNQIIGEGTVTVRVDDGQDLNGDGVIGAGEGDGDLADDPSDVFTITSTGSTIGTGVSHTVSIVVTPSGTDAGSPNLQSLTLNADIVMSNTASIDSWDSSLGAYGGANQGSSAHVVTNATGSNKVKLTNTARINGNVVVGAGADPDNVIQTSRANQITGSKSAADAAAEIVLPDIPIIAASSGDKTYSSSMIVNSNMRVGNLQIKDNATVTIVGNVTIVVDGDFTVSNNAKLQLASGASLTIYAKKKVEFVNNTKINATLSDPTRLRIYAYDESTPVKLDNHTAVYAQITAAGKLDIANFAQLYGTFVGRELQMKNSAKFHQDLRSTGEGGGGGGGGGSGGATYAIRWVESR